MNLKSEFEKLFILLMETKEILAKLKKYKGNQHYKTKFLLKVKEINKSSLVLKSKLKKSNNRKLASLFGNIEGDIQTIIQHKNPETSLDEIEYIEDFWPKIEIVLEEDEESERYEERIYDAGSAFDFHVDLRDIVTMAKKEIFIIEPYIDEDLLEITLRGINKSINIKILSNLHNPKGKFVKVSNKFISQHQGKFDARETDKVHDRGIFIDNQEGWAIGQSLKQGGKKPTYIIKLKDSKKLEDIYHRIFLNSKRTK